MLATADERSTSVTIRCQKRESEMIKPWVELEMEVIYKGHQKL